MTFLFVYWYSQGDSSMCDSIFATASGRFGYQGGSIDDSQTNGGCKSPCGKKKVHTDFLIGTPKGTRTPDSAVRGRRLNRLTMGAYYSKHELIILYKFKLCKCILLFLYIFSKLIASPNFYTQPFRLIKSTFQDCLATKNGSAP